jgi:hypothetical protein
MFRRQTVTVEFRLDGHDRQPTGGRDDGIPAPGWGVSVAVTGGASEDRGRTGARGRPAGRQAPPVWPSNST